MEIIRKKICINDFICHLPLQLETENVIGDLNSNNSWGKIPKKFSILGKLLDYNTFIEIYNKVFNVVISARYYTYDNSGNKWLKLKYDWRKVFYEDNNNVSYSTTLPETDLTDRMVVGLVDDENVYNFYDLINEVFDSTLGGFYFLNQSHSVIGKIITPPTHNGTYVPYYIYVSEIPTLITNMENIKSQNHNCCNVKLYAEYGGDDFLSFLRSKEGQINANVIFQRSYISIPILLTSTIMDLGGYRSYDVDDIDEATGSIINNDNNIKQHITPTIVKTQGESKLNTLRKRKRSYDDNNNELPFIIDEITEIKDGNGRTIDLDIKYSDIYVPNYIKNISVNGLDMHGDTVVSITEIQNAKVINEERYNQITNLLNKKYFNNIFNIKYFIKNIELSDINIITITRQNNPGDLIIGEKYVKFIWGTETQTIEYVLLSDFIKNNIYKNIEIINESSEKKIKLTWKDESNVNKEIKIKVSDLTKINDYITTYVVNQEITYGTNNTKVNDINNFISNDYENRLKLLETEYIQNFNNGNKDCFIIKYMYIYKTNSIEGENQTIKEGCIYISYGDIEKEITYVLGAKIVKSGGSLVLNEESPFLLSKQNYNRWNGDGIWYKERYPVIKFYEETYKIENFNKTFIYDKIDYKSKETTYSFEGIDFVRKNYILCDDIRYKSDVYINNCTSDPIFRDEKLMAFKFQANEEYDVEINRGTAAAFERHLQLSELKTWEDLETYRNGMFIE